MNMETPVCSYRIDDEGKTSVSLMQTLLDAQKSLLVLLLMMGYLSNDISSFTISTVADPRFPFAELTKVEESIGENKDAEVRDSDDDSVEDDNDDSEDSDFGEGGSEHEDDSDDSVEANGAEESGDEDDGGNDDDDGDDSDEDDDDDDDGDDSDEDDEEQNQPPFKRKK